MPGMIQWNNGNEYKLRIQFMEEEGILLVAARAWSAQCGHTRETCLNKYIRKFIRKQNVYVSFHEEKKEEIS